MASVHLPARRFLSAHLIALIFAGAAMSEGLLLSPTEYPPRPVIAVAPQVAAPETFTAVGPRIPPLLLKEWVPSGPSKVECGLREFVDGVRHKVEREGPLADARSLSTERFRVSRSGRVQVYVHCSRWNEEARAALERAGMLVETVGMLPRPVAQGWLPFDSVDTVAALDFVAQVGPPAYPVVHTGSKTAESDVILKAATARILYSVDGTGTRVGVLSDSVDQRSEAQATGDLPPDSSIYIGKEGSGADEGTAMLEIVHDEAPGALLGFYGPDTSLDMAAGIADLKNHGCGIICDDLAYIDQPCFEEGAIEQAITNVVAGGSVYVTCAANYAQQHYAATYSNVAADVLGSTGVNVHSFGSLVSGVPAYLMPVNCPADTTTFIVLQWDSPWGYASDDYDLFLCDLAATGYFAKSDNAQNGSQYPLEIIAFNPGSSGGWGFVLIRKTAGASRKLKVYVMRGGLDSHYRVAAGSIGFNNKAQNAIVVGAISSANFGGGTIEPFSGQGPVTISYPSPATWNKPDITGIDGVQVTGAGGFPVPFYGTSAASPSVAGVVSLMRSARPSATVEQVKAALTQTASDRGTTGYDHVYGWGLADAVTAIQALLPAYHLMFYASPTSAVAGSPFSTQPVVAVLDKNNSLVSSFSGAVTLSIKSGTGTAGAVLNGTKTVNVVGGMASFTGLSINLAGTGYVLTATAPDVTSADSSAFNVSAAPTPAKLAFSIQPGGANANDPLSPQPVVAAQDAIGLTVTSFNGPVTLAIKSGTGTTGATLKGATTVNAVNGIATFAGLSVDKGGTGYVLTATSGTIAPADSNAFNITATYPPGDLDKNFVFNMADLVLGARVLGGLATFP
jgi:hypothetical protein